VPPINATDQCCHRLELFFIMRFVRLAPTSGGGGGGEKPQRKQSGSWNAEPGR
jgi:hypothetical protein